MVSWEQNVLGVRPGLRVFAMMADRRPCFAAVAAEFQARGNEPGWVATVTDMAIELRTMDGKVVVVSPKPRGSCLGDFCGQG